jgi:RNA polymerase sigma-70 factor (ECF subfamily)
VSEGRISPHEAQELDACFRAEASDLFGYACAVTRGDQALSHDLVQAAFEAAALSWRGLRGMAHEARRAWLRRTLASIAVSGFRREAPIRDRLSRIELSRIDLPRIEMLSRKPPAGPLEQAFPPIALDRCWQVIGGLPEQQHAAALLRWGLGMKEGEIAAVLGIAEKTVSAHLYRIRRKLLLQLGADRPFDDDAGEGASP